MVVVIYDTDPRSNMEMVLREAIDVPDLKEARKMIKELFYVEKECAEWNIKNAWLSSTSIEAHVYGYCVDEHVMITVQDTAPREVI